MSEQPINEEPKAKKLCPLFGDIGIVSVEWTNPEHRLCRIVACTVTQGLGEGIIADLSRTHPRQKCLHWKHLNKFT